MKPRIIATTKSNLEWFLYNATNGARPLLDMEPVHWCPMCSSDPLFIDARLLDGLIISMHAFMWRHPIQLPPDLDQMRWKGGSVRRYLEVRLTSHEKVAIIHA